jgi:hypothetical protein
MAAASSDWISYYRSNRVDGGTIEALYAFDDDELAEISKGHNNEMSARSAIPSPAVKEEGGGNVLWVLGHDSLLLLT